MANQYSWRIRMKRINIHTSLLYFNVKTVQLLGLLWVAGILFTLDL